MRLVEGEALFSVAHDAARPFRVVVGDAIVQAVGTQFDVDRRATSTTVSVIDGVVQIASSGAAAPQSIIGPKAPSGTSRDVIESRPVRTKVRLAAGEQATVSAGGHIVTRSSPELVAQVGAWRERRLVFRGDSLDRVADEFNRYNALVIRIEGDGIRNKHLTGVFDADDPESLVLFLAQDSDMTVDRRGEAIVIRSR